MVVFISMQNAHQANPRPYRLSFPFSIENGMTRQALVQVSLCPGVALLRPFCYNFD